MEHRSDGSRDLRVLHFEGWEGDLPASTSELLHLIDTLESTRAHFTGSPVVIQCIDGSSKSGLFCALCDVISRVTHDKEVDVYLTIRELHNVRPQAVTSVVQYRYCYEVAQRRVKNLIMQTSTALGTNM
ncbi:receptor-type tyrosine-protein phosphatase alpha-like [Pomacea canaliculata]|uniref:receptor-type tyrosine-protein phosphatase alpha-like n=1 Tax=Pomacea canaliculata TaxID=400727 RepID=UPI000D7297E6|nr:receptor-type tyrosine-protein phosphatase alpha-like [Pomacea canaliculata]